MLTPMPLAVLAVNVLIAFIALGGVALFVMAGYAFWKMRSDDFWEEQD